jgi:hypothetical protein
MAQILLVEFAKPLRQIEHLFWMAGLGFLAYLSIVYYP